MFTDKVMNLAEQDQTIFSQKIKTFKKCSHFGLKLKQCVIPSGGTRKEERRFVCSKDFSIPSPFVSAQLVYK